MENNMEMENEDVVHPFLRFIAAIGIFLASDICLLCGFCLCIVGVFYCAKFLASIGNSTSNRERINNETGITSWPHIIPTVKYDEYKNGINTATSGSKLNASSNANYGSTTTSTMYRSPERPSDEYQKNNLKDTIKRWSAEQRPAKREILNEIRSAEQALAIQGFSYDATLQAYKGVGDSRRQSALSHLVALLGYKQRKLNTFIKDREMRLVEEIIDYCLRYDTRSDLLQNGELGDLSWLEQQCKDAIEQARQTRSFSP